MSFDNSIQITESVDVVMTQFELATVSRGNCPMIRFVRIYLNLVM